MSWYGGTADPVPRPIPKRDCDLFHLVEGMNDHDAPTGQFSIIMASLIRYCKMKCVVELGVSKGGTTVFLADACRDTGGVCFAIDKTECSEARIRLHNLGLEGPYCYFIQGKTGEVSLTQHTAYNGQKIDLLFIDAGHTYEDIKSDWTRWTPQVRIGGWVFVDNMQSEPEVRTYIVEMRGQSKFWNQWDSIICPESYGMGIFRKIA